MRRTLSKSIICAVAAFTFMVPQAAVAGPFETASAYYGNKYGVPDFTFTKSEFGNTSLGQKIHLKLEVIVEHFWGATVVYNPATDEVLVWGSVGSYSPGKEPDTVDPYTSGCSFTYGSVVMVGGTPFCVPGSSVGTASSHPQTVLLSHTPAKPRECTFDAGKDGFDVHSC